MSNHFNAPRRIGSFYSAPVDKEQWKLEAKKIFNTDLALLQYHNLGIAQGLGHDLPRAINLLGEFDIDARGIMLFPAPGSKNIKVSALLGFVCACAACWIFTWEINEGVQNETALLVTWVLLWMWESTKLARERVSAIWDKLSQPGFYGVMFNKLQSKLGLAKPKLCS
jgi:hypothetical protein